MPDVPHLIGRRDRDVEVREALFDPLREVGRADDVRAGLLCLARLVALGEDGDAHVLARSVRQHQRAAQLLVGVANVQAEAEVHLDGLVELRVGERLQLPHCDNGRVRRLAVDLVASSFIPLAVMRHYRSTSTPIDRAVPAMISAA